MKVSARTGRSRQVVESIRRTCFSGRCSKRRIPGLCLRRTSTLVHGVLASCRSGYRASTSRAGEAGFRPEQLTPARCPLLGYALFFMQIEGTQIPHWLLEVNQQAEVGEEGYDVHAENALGLLLSRASPAVHAPRPVPKGQDIINCLLSRGTLADFESVLVPDGTGGADRHIMALTIWRPICFIRKPAADSRVVAVADGTQTHIHGEWPTKNNAVKHRISVFWYTAAMFHHRIATFQLLFMAIALICGQPLQMA